MKDLLQFVEALFYLEFLCVEFSLTSFRTLKYDCVIKAREIFNFLPIINISVNVFPLISTPGAL